jgi:hypothetical protein
MALYRHLNKIPFEFGLFQNSGQLSALSHPLKDKSNFTTESQRAQRKSAICGFCKFRGGGG